MENLIKILKEYSEIDNLDYRFLTKDEFGVTLWTEEPIEWKGAYQFDDIEGSHYRELGGELDLPIPFIYKL